MQAINKIVANLLEDDEVDPKDMAMSIGSELFEDFMRNYRQECFKLLAAAKSSGAVPDDMPEGVLIRIIMQEAAERFLILTAQYKKDAKNIRLFL